MVRLAQQQPTGSQKKATRRRLGVYPNKKRNPQDRADSGPGATVERAEMQILD